jgi:predicted  nucleic acid-binding Zn ribbon protein
MILHELTFGNIDKKNREDGEDVAQSYIATLLHNGQACGEYFIVVREGNLIAYVNLQGIRAQSLKYHSKYGMECLEKVTDFFGRPPEWKLADDDAPKRHTTWAKAPFLYLFTHIYDWESPLCRGDNGKPIPLYRLSNTHKDREAVYSWQHTYHQYDGIWLGSGELEIPAYKQLADPSSELSQQGRQICISIEKTTGVATYYFLMRYWGRRSGEDKRACPSCGRAWRSNHPIDHPGGWWQFAFQCHSCRLVSHVADSDEDERHAVIGEYKKQRERTKAPVFTEPQRNRLTRAANERLVKTGIKVRDVYGTLAR